MQIWIYERGEFDWDDENIEHIARHGVEPWEAEDAILDPDRVGASARNVPGERRFVVGSTEPGRMLFVVFTRRAERIRVVTARAVDDSENRRYRRSAAAAQASPQTDIFILRRGRARRPQGNGEGQV